MWFGSKFCMMAMLYFNWGTDSVTSGGNYEYNEKYT